jgi:hypothetical protein
MQQHGPAVLQPRLGREHALFFVGALGPARDTAHRETGSGDSVDWTAAELEGGTVSRTASARSPIRCSSEAILVLCSWTRRANSSPVQVSAGTALTKTTQDRIPDAVDVPPDARCLLHARPRDRTTARVHHEQLMSSMRPPVRSACCAMRSSDSKASAAVGCSLIRVACWP